MSFFKHSILAIHMMIFANPTYCWAASSPPPQAPLCRLLPQLGQFQDLQSLARSGDPAALFCIGERYYRGQGVPQNFELASQWISASAKQKYPPAIYLMGEILLEGQGVTQNTAEAVLHIRSAAELGDSDAQAKLGYLYENGIGIEANTKEAAAWYARASMSNNPSALFRLGCMFLEGREVRKDMETGTLLIFSAALKGQTEALSQLRKIADPAPDSIFFAELDITQAKRTSFREAMHKNAVQVLREDDHYFCDKYNLEGVLPQGKVMTVCYSQGEEASLSLIKIDYTSKTLADANSVLTNLKNRIGAPTAQENKISYLWNFGKVFLVGQYMPTANETSLIYIISGARGKIAYPQ